MPLYEYNCPACEITFETLVFDGDTVECPECEGTKVKRLLSLPAKPKSDSLSMSCDPGLPPCGPGCCRMPE